MHSVHRCRCVYHSDDSLSQKTAFFYNFVLIFRQRRNLKGICVSVRSFRKENFQHCLYSNLTNVQEQEASVFDFRVVRSLESLPNVKSVSQRL